MKRTKIVATLGPKSNNEKIIEKMVKAGMNVTRLNLSHGTHEYHKDLIDKVKAVREKLNEPIAIMLDTKGPEIRLKDFEKGKVTLIEGQNFTITGRDIIGNENEVAITFKDLPNQMKKGNTILIDDGRVKLEVVEVVGSDIMCVCVTGGVISNHKGVNVPKIHLDFQYLSEADKDDLLFGIENKVDFIAASFVRCAEDVKLLRQFINFNGGHSIKIISKIENLEGIENFSEILKYSDGIMVARGDMGVEVEFEKLPGLQKRFITSCVRQGKMCITATQMLESMITSKSPTRAEISDVANAVFDGTSAVMLSGETAAGENPVLAVTVMAKIARQAEKDAIELGAYRHMSFDIDTSDTTNAVCDAACTTAKDINAKAIITLTKMGRTARGISKFRPQVSIIAATTDINTYYQLALSWGVFPVMAKNQKSVDALFLHAVDCAKEVKLVEKDDIVVIVAGYPLDITGGTNILKVEKVGE